MAVRSAWKSRRELTQISRSFERSRHRILLRLGGPSPIALGVKEKERLVVAVIKMRNCYRPSNTAAEGIEALWSLVCEVEHVSIECVVLQILEETSMKVVRSSLSCERNVTNLRKLSIVVKSCDLQFRDSFRRGIRVCPSSTVEDVRRGNSVDR